jgi:hypothetical protein
MRSVITAYTSEKTVSAMLDVTRMRSWPTRSAKAPVNGAENADEYVRNPRNSPDANVVPPRSMM